MVLRVPWVGAFAELFRSGEPTAHRKHPKPESIPARAFPRGTTSSAHPSRRRYDQVTPAEKRHVGGKAALAAWKRTAREDESENYEGALKRHYASGAPPTWQQENRNHAGT